jgi:hypothetical protein
MITDFELTAHTNIFSSWGTNFLSGISPWGIKTAYILSVAGRKSQALSFQVCKGSIVLAPPFRKACPF